MTPLKKAFVWAAGLGTRLRPYTYETPKPLMEVGGRPLLEYPLRYLAHAGIEEVTINTWHLADQFESVPEWAAEFGLRVELSRQPDRFEHGGDLAYARDFLSSLGEDEPFVGLNGDTLFYLDPDLLHHAATQISAEAPVLLIVREGDVNPLHLEDGRLVGIGEWPYVPDASPTDHADDFGIKVFHASVRDALPSEPGTFSFHGRTGLVSRLIEGGREIRALRVEEYERVEIGTVEDYEGRAENDALNALVRRLAALPAQAE